MMVDTTHSRRQEQIAVLTIRVERTTRGRWQVAAPDRERILCETLDEARHAAYVSAARVSACELVVHDAYHRVLSCDRVNGDPEAAKLDDNADHRRAAPGTADM